MLLRGEEDLSRPTGDVDILVAPSLLPIVDGILREGGLHRVHAPGHGSHRFYLGLDEEGPWIKLDIVSDLTFGPLQQWVTPLAGDCLARRVRRGSFWLPAPADQAWLQILHLVMDKGRIPADRVPAARRAGVAAAEQDAIARLIDQWTGSGTASQLLRMVRSGSGEPAAQLGRHIRRAWTRSTPAPVIRRIVVNRIQRLVSPTLAGRKSRGHVVAVLGPDGAGKTTLLRGIGSGFPLPAKYIHLGLWTTSALDPILARIPGGRLGKKVLRLLKGGAAARYHRRRGRLVLLDRAAYDALLPGSVDLSLGGRISTALAFRLGPTPDAVLFLDAPGELMFARKGEHSPEVLEGWRQAYRGLAEQLPNAWILDARQPEQLVQRQATNIVWRSMVNGPPTPGRRTGRRLPETAA
ncbi:hypothetical protein D6T65_17270 [Arthrobacter frigidicola]|nr:hypothetical protein D6T65_17270 [Arthrobacter frigidicola]